MLKLEGAARAEVLKGEITFIEGRLAACLRIIEATKDTEQESLFWLLWDEMHALLARLGRCAR